MPTDMNYRFPHYERTLLIVTYGRTGSTLLMSLLNHCLPDTDIRGENMNLAYSLYGWYTGPFRQWQSFSDGAATMTNPWYGAHELSESAVMKAMGEFALNAIYPHGSDKKTLGFKEIRYISSDLGVNNASYKERLFSYLDFLARLFKNVAVVFNTRNPEDVKNSSWWKDRDNSVIEEFKLFDTATDAYLKEHGESCYKVCYDDYAGNAKNLEGLFDFLRCPFDVLKLGTVMKTRHSF